MQIGNQIINNYDTGIQDRNKVEYTSDQIKHAQSLAETQTFKEGSVFKGEVLNVIGDKITIFLEDQTQLLAKLQEDVKLGVGDRLFFSVKENNSSQILIKPLFDSLQSAQTQVLERALDAAGLSPTEKNFSVAKELMDSGMPVDKGNMVKLLSQSLKYEGTSLQTLVGLNKMQIPVNEVNIAQYERYQGHQHQLSNDIQIAANHIADFTKTLPEGTKSSQMLTIANQIADIFIENQNIDNEQANTVIQDNTSEQTVLQQQNIQESQTGILLNQAHIAGNEDLSHEIPIKQDVFFNTQTMDGEEVQIEKQDKNTTNIVNEKYALQDSELQQVKKEVSANVQDNTVPQKIMNQVTDLLNELGMPKENVQTIVQNTDSTESLLKNLLQQLATGNETMIKQTLESNEFKFLLEEVVKKNWSIQPRNMQDPKEIDELYERIVKQSKSFENIMINHDAESGTFEQNFQNMRQNIQFMEQLNQQMIYAQMPLKLSNQNTNSELYVYADKRKLAQKKDGISVMLHLDMDSLGQTDVHVTLTGNNVNARFYLNDGESVTIVSDNMNQLAKKLAERGFSLTNEVVRRQPQESVNKVIDEVIDENAERSIKRYTFDART